MDRLEQLLHYYTKCRRGAALQHWKELCELPTDDPTLSTVDAIQSFYEYVLADLQEQTKWYTTVFRRSATGSSRVLLPIYTQVNT